MNNKPNFNTIRMALDQIQGLKSSGQTELRLGRQQALNLEHALATLLLYTTELQNKVIELQEKVNEVINVEFDAGKFDD